MHAAVFVDFENLFLSLKNRDDLSGIRTRDLSLMILEALKSKLQQENCPMILGRSYAAFDSYPGMEVAHDLALMGLDPQYVLISHSGKNSADVQLAVDVARVLFRRPDIDVLVIVSGDRDFIPIARQVLEESRELRVVAIPDTTSGDLRMRVGDTRFWNALDLIPEEARANLKAVEGRPATADAVAAAEPESIEPVPPAQPSEDGVSEELEADTEEEAVVPVAPPPPGARPNIVGHIPVTWKTNEEIPEEAFAARLSQCLELVVRAQIRHGSREIWLSPFLKGPMSQHFSHLVHPERRALINELRDRGIIRVEERDNMYADHPYSVIVLEEEHPMVRAATERVRRARGVTGPGQPSASDVKWR